MTVRFLAGDRDDVCGGCGERRAPIVVVEHADADAAPGYRCVYCLARAIDMVTGWTIVNQVMQSLAVGDASERFRTGLPPREGNGAADRARKWRQARKSLRRVLPAPMTEIDRQEDR